MVYFIGICFLGLTFYLGMMIGSTGTKDDILMKVWLALLQSKLRDNRLDLDYKERLYRIKIRDEIIQELNVNLGEPFFNNIEINSIVKYEK
jgi:hypothetical protein